MKTDRRPLAVRFALILALATLACGFTYILNKDTGLPIKLPAGSTPVTLMLGNSPTYSDGTTPNTSAQAAVQIWNAQLGSLQLQPTLVAAGTATDDNDINELAFAATIFGKEFDANTLAITTTWRRGNERAEGDILFNSKWTWDSHRGNRRSGIVDIQRVALHELGHLLGLDHPDENGQTVTALMNSQIGNRDTLSDDDITGARNLYGPPGIPANNNFANAEPLTLSGSTSLTVTGYNTNATKELGEPRHAGDTGGHSVWWKWLAPSAGSVTIDTRGSYFDTTLGIYTGSSIAALTLIASNDDITRGTVQASTVTFTTTAGTTYYLAVDGFDGDSAGITLNLAFTSTGPSLPLFTTQPTSLTVTAGQSASFTVAASSTTPLTYQWSRNGIAISGATGPTHTIASAQTGDAGSYTVVVTNSAGNATSNAATLTVNPVVVVNPPSPPSSGGGGGGGGAPSLWFIAALSALGLARRLRGLHR